MPHAPKHIVAVSARVTNAAGDILMVRSPKRGWELPGGQVEIGESLTDALKREIQEESGVRAQVGRLLSVRSNLSSAIVIFCFEARYLAGQLTPSEESPEVRWVAPEQALQLIRHPALRHSFRALAENANGVHYHAYTVNPYRVVEENAAY